MRDIPTRSFIRTDLVSSIINIQVNNKCMYEMEIIMNSPPDSSHVH